MQVTDWEMDTDSDADTTDRPQYAYPTKEGELSDHEQDTVAANFDQAFSQETKLIETMRGITSYFGWSHIPDFDTATSAADGNPIGGPKEQKFVRSQ